MIFNAFMIFFLNPNAPNLNYGSILRMNLKDTLSNNSAFVRVDTSLLHILIFNLHYSMVLEYAEQVERVRRGAQPAKLTLEAANYVQHHLSEPIRTEDMAKTFFMSRTHLSARFKKETGLTLIEH